MNVGLSMGGLDERRGDRPVGPLDFVRCNSLSLVGKVEELNLIIVILFGCFYWSII